MFKKSKILKVKCEKYSNTPPEINVWNFFDNEHAHHIHSKRNHGDGMERDQVMIENKDFCLTISEQRLPIFNFIKRKSMVFHYVDQNNSAYQWSSFWGIPIVQKFSCAKESKNGLYKHTIQYAFELSGIMVLFSKLIEKLSKKWMDNTWNEDLVMKQRYYKFLKYGFENMKGLPKKFENRNIDKNSVEIKIPLPRIMNEVTSHPFYFKDISKVFDE